MSKLRAAFAAPCAAIALASALCAQASPSGGEVQVNTFTSGDQRFATVAADPAGNLVVTWTSYGSPGSDDSGYSIQARRFASNGTADGPQFQVNSYVSSTQRESAVACDALGGFVVAWSSLGSSGSDESSTSIQAQRFDSSGSPQGAQFQVNTYTVGIQAWPAVAAGASGNFVVVWESDDSGGSDDSFFSIQAQRYAANGAPQGGETQVNVFTSGMQAAPAVAADTLGNFVVVWESAGSPGNDSSSYSIQARRYDANGAPLGSQFQVNTFTTDAQRAPAVAADAQGNFVVAWRSDGSSGSDHSYTSIHARPYAANGTPLAGQFQVNTYFTGIQSAPTVASDGRGHVVVAWQSDGSSGPDNDFFSIQAQRYGVGGTALDGQFQVNTYSGYNQVQPAVAVDPLGNFVVAWQSIGSNGNDDLGYSIQAQRFDGVFRDGFETGNSGRWSSTIP